MMLGLLLLYMRTAGRQAMAASSSWQSIHPPPLLIWEFRCVLYCLLKCRQLMDSHPFCTFLKIPATPRLEYVFTAPGGDVGSPAPLLNGPGGSILRVLEDGSLPPLPGRWVPQGGAPELTLPPLSQAFFVLLDAGASACMK